MLILSGGSPCAALSASTNKPRWASSPLVSLAYKTTSDNISAVHNNHGYSNLDEAEFLLRSHLIKKLCLHLRPNSSKGIDCFNGVQHHESMHVDEHSTGEVVPAVSRVLALTSAKAAQVRGDLFRHSL